MPCASRSASRGVVATRRRSGSSTVTAAPYGGVCEPPSRVQEYLPKSGNTKREGQLEISGAIRSPGGLGLAQLGQSWHTMRMGPCFVQLRVGRCQLVASWPFRAVSWGNDGPIGAVRQSGSGGTDRNPPQAWGMP